MELQKDPKETQNVTAVVHSGKCNATQISLRYLKRHSVKIIHGS